MSSIKSKFSIFMAGVIAAGVLTSGCGIIQKTPEAIAKEKVAKVGSEYITRGELDEFFKPVSAQIAAQNGGAEYLSTEDGKTALAENKKSLLDNLVDMKVFEIKAKELKLFKDENEISTEVDKQLADLKTQNQLDTDEKFNKYLTDSGMTLDILKKYLRAQVISEKVIDNMVKDVTVTDQEIKDYYNEHRAELTEKPNTMKVSHILLKTEDEAKQVKAKLDAGGDFAALAKQYSTDTGSKDAGGDLGEIQYNDPNYDSTFVTAAMALKEGQVSNPIQTQFGYHIIKVFKKTEYPILTLDQAKDQIKSSLLSQNQQTKYDSTLKDWKDKLKVTTYEKNIDN